MSEEQKLKVVPEEKEAPVPHPTNIFDDLKSLRKKSKQTVVRKSVLINVDVDRPPNNVYFRVNPDPDMMLEATVVRDNDGTKKVTYYVTPGVLEDLDMPGRSKLMPRIRKVTIALVTTWPTGDVLLWPVPILDDRDIKAWKSSRVAFKLAQTKWVMMIWSAELGDYVVETAEEITHEPVWPKRSFSEILKVGFADKVIDNAEHPYVLRLRGVIND